MSLILSPKLLTICRPTSLDPLLILSAISPTTTLLFFLVRGAGDGEREREGEGG